MKDLTNFKIDFGICFYSCYESFGVDHEKKPSNPIFGNILD